MQRLSRANLPGRLDRVNWKMRREASLIWKDFTLTEKGYDNSTVLHPSNRFVICFELHQMQ